MRNKIIMRHPLKLPHQTFGEEFSFDELTMENPQTGYILLVTGERVAEETGTAVVQFDAVLPDESVVEGIKFLKATEESFRYEEVESDQINIEDCPTWREYMITGRMLAKYGSNRIRVRISAVTDSETKCCIIAEATDLRYSSEKPYDD